MTRVAPAAEVTPWRLSPAAVCHLAHDLRGSIHVIRGHAELLGADAAGAEARESVQYILDASIRLGGMCEDVIDFLRMPGVAPDEPVALAFDDLGATLAILAADCGTRLRIVEPDDGVAHLLVNPSVRRVAMHVLEHVARTAASDVTIAAAISSPRESCIVSVAPVPIGLVEGEDGIIAVAAELLSARGGNVCFAGRRMDLRLPVVGARQ